MFVCAERASKWTRSTQNYLHLYISVPEPKADDSVDVIAIVNWALRRFHFLTLSRWGAVATETTAGGWQNGGEKQEVVEQALKERDSVSLRALRIF